MSKETPWFDPGCQFPFFATRLFLFCHFFDSVQIPLPPQGKKNPFLLTNARTHSNLVYNERYWNEFNRGRCRV